MLPEKYLLAFDTSAAHCAAALLCGDRVVCARLEPMEKGQAERLMVMLEEMLTETGIAWRDLAAVAVGVGPGNFTGVRISVSAARGLALGLGVPAIGVTRFDAIALDLAEPVAVVEDARRDEAYVQSFGPDAVAARLCRLNELPGLIGAVPLVGSVAQAAALVTGGAVVEARYALAEAIARVALLRLGTDQPRPAPFYLRAADAAPSSEPPLVILP